MMVIDVTCWLLNPLLSTEIENVFASMRLSVYPPAIPYVGSENPDQILSGNSDHLAGPGGAGENNRHESSGGGKDDRHAQATRDPGAASGRTHVGGGGHAQRRLAKSGTAGRGRGGGDDVRHRGARAAVRSAGRRRPRRIATLLGAEIAESARRAVGGVAASRAAGGLYRWQERALRAVAGAAASGTPRRWCGSRACRASFRSTTSGEVDVRFVNEAPRRGALLCLAAEVLALGRGVARRRMSGWRRSCARWSSISPPSAASPCWRCSIGRRR